MTQAGETLMIGELQRSGEFCKMINFGHFDKVAMGM